MRQQLKEDKRNLLPHFSEKGNAFKKKEETEGICGDKFERRYRRARRHKTDTAVTK